VEPNLRLGPGVVDKSCGCAKGARRLPLKFTHVIFVEGSKVTNKPEDSGYASNLQLYYVGDLESMRRG
jgi:hypothetical protein